MLYIFDEINALDDRFIEHCLPYLSQERRDKAMSCGSMLDRKLSVAAYTLLRYALSEGSGMDKICKVDEPVVFAYGRYGKPYLRDYPNTYFNLSHCRNAVACVVSQKEVGVDVQEIRPVSDAVARRVLTENEYIAFKTSKDPAKHFCRYWAIKESWLKLIGTGISTDLKLISAEDIIEKTVVSRGGYYCCVAGISDVQIRILDYCRYADYFT